MTTIHNLLDEYRALSSDERNKGQFLERMIKSFLQVDPQYADLLGEVWLWDEWTDRWGSDDGIDLVAQERGTGDYWAIQCKFYDSGHSLQKADIDSFFTASGKRFATISGERDFARRVIVSTTEKWSSKADTALDNQTPPVFKLGLKDLEESPVDWAAFSLKRVKDIRLKAKKEPWKHQPDAINAVVEGFKMADRGKLIMACGTGKTFTSLRLMEQLVPENGQVLFLAPSISLVAQTLREWTAQAQNPIHAFVVCSDTKVGKDEEDIRTSDLAYPATTDARKLASHAQILAGNRRTVIFSTYQSIQVVADAQKAGLDDFDLIICDEAHRTTGLTLKDDKDHSEFVKVHHNHIVRGSKRLYMTATPRIYADASKTKANDKEAILFSMDDETIYGQEFYRLGFGEAVHKWEVLSDYKVLIVAVDEDRMAELANKYNEAVQLKEDGNKDLIDIRLATKIIGSWKGLSKRGIVTIGEDGEQETLTEDPQPMRRAVAFSKSIKASKQMTRIFGDLVKTYLHSTTDTNMVDCELKHVDGNDNTLKRQVMLDWLKTNPGDGRCSILSNARCLSEGIDVPSLDAVVFFDTRESIVDIVQSVGRVMRKADGKQYGYIILPVAIPSSKVKDYNTYLQKDEQFKGIWKVIKALRAHDESLVDEAEFRSKIRVITGGGGGDGTGGGGQIDIDFEPVPLGDLSEAVYAAIPKKLGDMEYWSEWAKGIGEVAARLIARIEALFASSDTLAGDFGQFLKGLRDTLNPAITRTDALEMLAQHILTLPVFQALFAGSDFPENNAVGKALQAIVTKLDAHAVATETEGLGKFYDNVRDRIAVAKSDKSKQDVIRNLYDTFFHNAFPRMAERLGIVYTPVEVVDFILHSAEFALQKHFGASLNDAGVQVLDPFTGTGTFMVRLLQSGLLKADKLPHKYAHELHANEIVLLAYYIANINIETAYHAVTGEYQPFAGMVLADTFQITEEGDIVDKVVLPENNGRIEHQLKQDIRVIIGNPPYSAQQDSENDNNKNQDYPTLDNTIRSTYAAQSKAKLVKNLYDSYIRAIRWASDRIKDQGIVTFVTNGSFLDANNMDGLRKCLTGEYSHLYVFNLRGNQRTSGKQSQQEGGKIFGSGSRTPVAITIMVKDPQHQGTHELHYYDIGDYLTREDKLQIISDFGSMANVPWQRLTPNAAGDWINQRDPVFDRFTALGNKGDASQNVIFDTYSQGVLTARDTWAYNFSKPALSSNMRRMIEAYNTDANRYKLLCSGKKKEQWPEIEKVIDTDPQKISWTRALKADVKRGKVYSFYNESLIRSMYRPFAKQWLYFNRKFNEMVYQMPRLFPTWEHSNVVISAAGVGANKPFSALISKTLPDYEMTSKGQCFPLYWYEKADTDSTEDAPDGQFAMFGGGGEQPDQHGYIRREAITDWALSAFRNQYQDDSISKEAIFWYVYGILHSPEYKTRFAADLKKMLPRIPFAPDFHAFSSAGGKLAALHLNYETAEPYPLVEEKNGFDFDKPSFYRVQKMVFGKSGGKPDKSVIVYNGNLTLRSIPLEVYEYVVNGKSALEWVMERYAVTKDRDSQISNDANQWSDDPLYIVDLIKRLVTVSVETMKVVKSLPSI